MNVEISLVEIVVHFPACLIERIFNLMNEMINSGKEDNYLHLFKLSQFATAA